MQSLAEQFDLYLCDGGSTDGSTAPEVVRPYGVAAVLTKTGPGKLSAQMRMGLAHTLSLGYKGIIVIDGNNKDDPRAIPRMATQLDRGQDHVQGSRFIPRGQAINTPKSRYFGVRLLHAPLLSLAAGFRYTDTTNGFRAYSRRLLLDPRIRPFRTVFDRYELHYYLAIQAARRGYRCSEVPVTRAYPKSGKVPTKIQGWRGNLLVLRTLGFACVGAYDAA
jgi:glycosyltransferase involved in cell wall biosynthesis